jgi:dihydropteroate synthase
MELKIVNKILSLDPPIVMGIINVTPDSFYGESRVDTTEKLIELSGKMIMEGASIIDIGGCSTRPGAKSISEVDEISRVIPAIKEIRKKFSDVVISIDTYRASVAKAALENGADIINDVSGGTIEPEIYNVAAQYKVPYILTHIQGTPVDMQQEPFYKNVVSEVFSFFENKITELKEKGIDKIILDPGFGFGKNLEHNYKLLAAIPKFKSFNLPILAGVSRKSMVNKVIHTAPANALNGTTVINTIALLNGANILRVHDVKEAKEAIQLVDFYKNIKENSRTKA